MESLEIAISYDNDTYPEKATLLSIIDDVYNYDLTDGKISIPDGFEGYLIVDYKGGKPIITLDKGERLGITDIFSLASGVEVENTNEVFNKSVTVLRTVSATDSVITEAFTVDGLFIKRAVNSYYTTLDAPSNFEDESVVAKVELLDDDNYIYPVRDIYPIYKSEEMYEGTPTINLALSPQLIKTNKKYVMYDQGETVNLKVTESGVIYVFAPKDFECDGFSKTMAMESFFNGIDGRVFCFKKDVVKDEVLAIDGAYLIIVDGEVSPFIALTLPSTQLFFDDIPNEYLLENFVFLGIPTVAQTESGRIFISSMSGGKTEPVVENVTIIYVSDNNGLTMSPYMLIDHPYETMARVYDPMFWYDNGRLWYFFTQADKGQAQMATYMCYTDNPDEEKLEDIVWSKPVYLAKGVLSEKPNKLSNGKIVFTTSLYNDVCDGKVHVFEFVDDKTPAKLLGVAEPNPTASFVFPEPKIVEIGEDILWLLKRVDGNNENRVEEAFSTDGGKTWTIGKFNDDLLCGSSRFVIDRLPSGNLIYIGNFGTERNRSHIKVLLSEDDGETWPYSLEIDHRTWVSYPDYTLTPDGKIMIIYDKGRTSEMELRYAVIDENDIKAGYIVSNGSSLMNLFIKNPKYKEITKIFALPETELDEVSGKNVVRFDANATRSDILKVFPSDGISVGLNNGELKQILGNWTLGRIDANGYGTVTFVPTTSLPWNIQDTYKLLETTILLADPVTQTGIEVTSNPTKTTYKIGEALDLTGLVVKEVYSDNTKVEITDYTVSGFDSSSAGTKTITVTKGNFSDTFTVTVESEETPSTPNTPTDTPTENKGGCGGTVETIGLIGLLGVALSTTLLKKKKK